MHSPSSPVPQEALETMSAAATHDTADTRYSTRGRTTEEFATDNLVQPQSVRKRYSTTGSWFGTVPEKLKNGRLKWPRKAS
jgi:hypothetical protein